MSNPTKHETLNATIRGSKGVQCNPGYQHPKTKLWRVKLFRGRDTPELKAPRTAEAKFRARRFLIEHRHLILSGRGTC